jgi:hypothetical protein
MAEMHGVEGGGVAPPGEIDGGRGGPPTDGDHVTDHMTRFDDIGNGNSSGSGSNGRKRRKGPAFTFITEYKKGPNKAPNQLLSSVWNTPQPTANTPQMTANTPQKTTAEEEGERIMKEAYTLVAKAAMLDIRFAEAPLFIKGLLAGKDYFQGLIQAIDKATNSGIEKVTPKMVQKEAPKRVEKEAPTKATPTYASVTATPDKEWNIVTKKGGITMKPATQKPATKLATPMGLVITGISTAFEPISVRNAINNALGTVIVTSATISFKGNLVLRPAPPMEKKDIWLPAIQAIAGLEKATIPDQGQWVKLLAHGVPIRPFSKGSSFNTELFKEELKIFNNIESIGPAYWLTTAENKLASSVVFYLSTDKAAKKAISQGINIAGTHVNIRPFQGVLNKTQCFKCQGYGHEPDKCRKKACRICGQNHYTKEHKCLTCLSNSQCPHTKVSCINCNKAHMAHDPICEVRKALKIGSKGKGGVTASNKRIRADSPIRGNFTGTPQTAPSASAASAPAPTANILQTEEESASSPESVDLIDTEMGEIPPINL